MTHEEFIDQYLPSDTWYIENGVLYIIESLYLRGAHITALPERLYINGRLYIEGSNITELPEGLSIGGGLYLQGTKITELPEGLSVGDGLWLRKTEVTSLPDGVIIKGVIYSDRKLSMSEKPQLSLIQQNEENFKVIKNPTKKAKALYNLLYKL